MAVDPIDADPMDLGSTHTSESKAADYVHQQRGMEGDNHLNSSDSLGGLPIHCTISILQRFPTPELLTMVPHLEIGNQVSGNQ